MRDKRDNNMLLIVNVAILFEINNCVHKYFFGAFQYLQKLNWYVLFAINVWRLKSVLALQYFAIGRTGSFIIAIYIYMYISLRGEIIT